MDTEEQTSNMNLPSRIKVKFFGFSEKDIARFSKIFDLPRENKRLYSVSSNDADVKMVIVNTNVSDAIQQFKDFRSQHPSIAIITIGPKKSRHHLSGMLMPSSVLKVLDVTPVARTTGVAPQPAHDSTPQPPPTVSTPTPPEVQIATTALASPETSSQQDNYQALVVDDSEMMQKAVSIEIKNIIFEIDIDFASSGEEALERVNAKQYDLIFLDIVMPGIDGFETCTIIRKKPNMKKTPVIMLTSKQAALDELKGVLSGCTSYLTKPVNRTEFHTLQLPRLLAATRTTATQTVTVTATETEKSDYQVLVVDDSEMMQKALEVEIMRTENANMHIDFADNGEQALELVGTIDYDLVFLDVVMPGIDGFEACTQMRKMPSMKKTPIIMVTSKTSPLDEVKGVMAGCTTYLTKPLKPESFQAMMRRVSSWLEKYNATA